MTLIYWADCSKHTGSAGQRRVQEKLVLVLSYVDERIRGGDELL